MYPQVEDLAKNTEGVFVRFIDMTDGWEVPVAQQHGIESIPHFVLVGPDGEIQKEGGPPVWNEIKSQLQE